MEKFEMPTIFFLKEVFTYGVTHGKYGGYEVPIVFKEGDNVLRELKELASQKNAELTLYGLEKASYTLRPINYLKNKETSSWEGKMIVCIRFHATGVYKKKNRKNGLKLTLVGMRKLKVPEKVLGPIPEDLEDE